MTTRMTAVTTVGAMALALVANSVVAGAQTKQVLIVMDEREQMVALAGQMEKHGGVRSVITDQAGVPDDWSGYDAVIGYIHGDLSEKVELKLIEYAKNGGRLILLHHCISTGKADNKYFFDFLGIELSEAQQAREPSIPGGHYAWLDPVDQVLVNLRPDHFITSHKIQWPEKVPYTPSDGPSAEREYPAFTLKHSEAYLNHKFTDGRAKTVLAGFKWTDARNGQLYMQDRVAWYKPVGKGWLFYFLPGHSTAEFEIPLVSQMILNAILWAPGLE